MPRGLIVALDGTITLIFQTSIDKAMEEIFGLRDPFSNVPWLQVHKQTLCLCGLLADRAEARLVLLFLLIESAWDFASLASSSPGPHWCKLFLFLTLTKPNSGFYEGHWCTKFAKWNSKLFLTTVSDLHGLQSMVLRPATSLSSGKRWEMQILRSHSQSTKLEILGLEPRNLCFNTVVIQLVNPSPPGDSHACSSLRPTGLRELKGQAEWHSVLCPFSCPSFKREVMHALLPLVSCPAGFLWPHPPSTTHWIWSRIVLPFLPHLCVCPSWLSGSGLLAGCWCSRIKTQCPALEASNRSTWHTRASLSFSGTSSGLSSMLSHSQGHTICPKTIAPFYCRNFCEFFSAPFVSSPPFTQEMCVTLLYIIALAGNLSSCSVWGTDYSWSCWRHLLSILPDHMAQPHVLTILANESSSYPAATLFMFYSIRLFQKFIQAFP